MELKPETPDEQFVIDLIIKTKRLETLLAVQARVIEALNNDIIQAEKINAEANRLLQEALKEREK